MCFSVPTRPAGTPPALTEADDHHHLPTGCAKSGCTQWTGSGCGVIDRVLQQLEREMDVAGQTPPGRADKKPCAWYAPTEDGVGAVL